MDNYSHSANISDYIRAVYYSIIVINSSANTNIRVFRKLQYEITRNDSVFRRKIKTKITSF